MKILVVVTDLEVPPRKGFQRIVLDRIQHLARTHTVIVVSIGMSIPSPEVHRTMANYGVSLIVLHVGPLRLVRNIVWGYLVRGEALQAALYTYDWGWKIKLLLEEHKIDVVYAIMARCWNDLRDCKVPCVMDMVDSMQVNYMSRLPHMIGLKKFFYALELQRMIKLENEVVGKATVALLVSRKDNMWPNAQNLRFVPLGIHLSTFRPTHTSKQYSFVFSGNMSYGPNQDAAEFFLTKCWPRILALRADATVLIVGRDATEVLSKYIGTKNATITGFVPDISATIQSAEIAVAPMLTGSGMQNKILEAMACAVPVVCTTKGLGDIRANHGTDIVVADDEAMFVTACINLLDDENRRTEIGRNGRRVVVEGYSVDCINKMVEDIIANLEHIK